MYRPYTDLSGKPTYIRSSFSKHHLLISSIPFQQCSIALDNDILVTMVRYSQRHIPNLVIKSEKPEPDCLQVSTQYA